MYNNSKLMMILPGVHNGSEAEFLWEPQIYFGVTSNEVHEGSLFAWEQTQALTPVPVLQDGFTGVDVVLTEEGKGGKYVFTPTPF